MPPYLGRKHNNYNTAYKGQNDNRDRRTEDKRLFSCKAVCRRSKYVVHRLRLLKDMSAYYSRSCKHIANGLADEKIYQCVYHPNYVRHVFNYELCPRRCTVRKFRRRGKVVKSFSKASSVKYHVPEDEKHGRTDREE